MPNWAIHLLIPLLALLIVDRKEDHKYILLLLPFAVFPDVDTFVTEHRALLHNIFIPLVLVLIGLSLKKMRPILFITAFYFASHVILDMFNGGVVFFYYGFSAYDNGWKLAQGYISDSVGTGSLVLVFVSGLWAARYRLLALKGK